MIKAKKPKIAISESSVERVAVTSYDLSFHALGFESRSADLAARIKPRVGMRVAIGFDHANAASYSHNLQIYRQEDFRIFEGVADTEFDGVVRGVLKELMEGGSEKKLKILVDVSCFNRYRLAAIITSLFDFVAEDGCSIEIDFFYSIAAFVAPDRGHAPNLVVGPAHARFAGWSQSGALSTAAILGLGYEQDQALGLIEHLQANPVWVLCPYSPVNEYLIEVRKANELLLNELPPGRLTEYDVTRPVQIITALQSIVEGLRHSHNIVMVPSGPKVFVLCCMLLGALNPEISIWRVSQGNRIQPIERLASGHSTVVRVNVDVAEQS